MDGFAIHVYKSGILCNDSVFFYNRTLGWFNTMHNTETDLSSNQTFRYLFMENCSVVDLSPLLNRKLDIPLVYKIHTFITVGFLKRTLILMSSLIKSLCNGS